ncbi:hypothetical protein [Streptomyces sp. NPDC092903]|uniref:hypothetical protein n=1 Tax=Streptomyces sp. NPDC092903 TaxID=3366017 RepID=UPI00382CB056
MGASRLAAQSRALADLSKGQPAHDDVAKAESAVKATYQDTESALKKRMGGAGTAA